MNSKRLAHLLVVGVALATAACSSDTSGSDSGGDGGGGKHHATDATTDSSSVSDPTSMSTTSTAASTGTTDPSDLHQRCVDKINSLRATKQRTPYTRWTSAESCVGAQATSDETSQSPHQAWGQHAGVCDGSGQNECEGQGADIEGCLDQMWGEKDQPNCAGCDACAGAYNPSCPGCDFSGVGGQVCGHYVNLSAEYFTEVACGFSSLGGWDAMNFQ